jgi:hypothetical protein
MALRSSAKANKADAEAEARKAQMKAMEIINHYDGAIQTLTLLIDDLRAQNMAAVAEREYQQIEAAQQGNGEGEVNASPDAITIDELQEMLPDNVTITGVQLREKED